MKRLDMTRDGVEAIDLGVIGEWQYALGTTRPDVWRRKASEVGTYGGWRWECLSLHAVQFAAVNPELAARVSTVTVED